MKAEVFTPAALLKTPSTISNLNLMFLIWPTNVHTWISCFHQQQYAFIKTGIFYILWQLVL